MAILPERDTARALLQLGDRIVCADAGARHARRLGLMPDLVVGDLDSIEADDRDWLVQNGVQVITYPHDKDQTDLELALQHALPENPQRDHHHGGPGCAARSYSRKHRPAGRRQPRGSCMLAG